MARNLDVEELRERALRALKNFKHEGSRFLGQSLSDFDAGPDGAFYELTVLCALLEAYEKQPGTLIFFEPRDPRRPIYESADIVIARPGLGYLTLEVKSHPIGDLRYENGQICVPYATGEQGQKLKPVVPQARRQLESLKKKLESEEKKGRKGGGSRCPAPPGGFVIALPRIRKCDFDSRSWSSNPLPREQILFEETLDTTSLRKSLSHAAKLAAEGRAWRGPITERHVQSVGQVLGGLPKGLRGEERERPANTIGGEISRLNESSCLRPDQRDLALRNLEGVPSLIRGVAGSGKSMLLAKSLARMVDRGDDVGEGERPLRILVTGFNRALIPLLRQDAAAFAAAHQVSLDSADIHFLHFEGVLRRLLRDQWGLDVPSFKQMSDEERMPHVLAQLDELFENDPQLEAEYLFDHVFVDEAQDLHHEALRLLGRLARIDFETGERGIAIYYDDAQNLYGKPRPRWKELGINVMGRSVVMTECRRTSRPIVTFAFNVLLGTALPDGERAKTREFADVRALEEKGKVIEIDEGMVIEFAERPGPAPEIHVFENEDEEIEQIVALVRDLIGREKVEPSEIVIQCAKWPPLKAVRAALEASGLVCHLVENAKDELIRREGCITLSTVMSAKGYDAPVTVLMSAQIFQTDSQSRAAFYVGATRAQVRLYVTASSDGPLVAEMLEVQKRLPRLKPYIS